MSLAPKCDVFKSRAACIAFDRVHDLRNTITVLKCRSRCYGFFANARHKCVSSLHCENIRPADRMLAVQSNRQEKVGVRMVGTGNHLRVCFGVEK